MAIKLPRTWLGEPVSGSMEQILKVAPLPPQEPPQSPAPVFQQPSGIVDPSSHIILPGRTHGSYSYPQIYVAMERSYLNEDWNQAHESLRKEDAFMLNPRQFVDFLALLKSGNAYDGTNQKIAESRLTEILNEIVEVRNPWRSEWLDAKFTKVQTGKKLIVLPKNEMHVTYHTHDGSGKLVEKTELLQDCLMEDKTPGIDFDYWLANATKQGLPPANCQSGQMYYWNPRDGRVARFYAGSDWADLYCDGNATDTNSRLGVRAARTKI